MAGDGREIDEAVLAEIRRAAFELRLKRPQEAVRVLRRCAAGGGGAEVLARGALGEIYLEDFGDLDGAESEFRKLLQAAPGLSAGEIGLGRVLREQGRTAEAQAAFSRAIAGLQRDVLDFRAAGQPPPGAEEVVLTLLEVALEAAALAAPKANGPVDLPIDEACLEWAAGARLFDALEQEEDGDDGGGADDWVRFHSLWARLRAIAGRAEEAARELQRAEAVGQLPAPHGARLLRDALEDAGDLAAAAVQGRRVLDEVRAADQHNDATEVLRAAALTAAAGDEPLAARLLEEALSQTRARLGQAANSGDAEREKLAGDEKRLQAALAEPGESLVRLGVRRH